MQDACGDHMQLLMDILARGEAEARQLEAAAPGGGEPAVMRAEHYRGLARELQCTFRQAISVAKAIQADWSASRGTDSPRSADESSGRTAANDAQERQDMSKKRKGLPRWTRKVRVPDASSDANPDDGYSWRKYGQKDILGAKFPRGYYRCTYRNAQGCAATKQVQRSDTDLSVFDITYQGVHTCHQRSRQAAPLPVVAGVQGSDQPPHDASQLQLLVSFKNGLTVDTGGLAFRRDHDDQDGIPSSSFSFPSVHCTRPENAAAFSPPAMEAGGLVGSFSPAFVSPAASGTTNYFSMSHCPVGNYGAGGIAMHGSESELSEVISAATTSPVDPAIAGFDYSLYHAELDPHLPFPPSHLFK